MIHSRGSTASRPVPVGRTGDSIAPRLALLVLVIALVSALVLSGEALAAGEQHQLVTGVRATFEQSENILHLELLLANGDLIRRTYTKTEEIERITAVLTIATRDKISLYADLHGKELVRLTIEFGSPIPFVNERRS